MLRAQVGGQPLVITRNKEGILRAFYNVCRHRGSLLVLEDKKHERFRCPYHSWTYDLDGTLLGCPLFELEKDEKKFNKNNYGLLPVRVSQYGCFIFVCLSQKTEALSDYLGDMPRDYKNFPLEELRLVRRKKYNIRANWKLIAENFLEYYHLPWVHPELCEVVPLEMHKRNQGAGMYMSFFASPLAQSNSSLDAAALLPMPGLTQKEQESGYFPFVFPNVAMFLLPHHLFSLILKPQGINLTQEYGDLLVHPSVFNDPEAQRKIDEIFAFYDMVNEQDIRAVERVQEGIMAQAYDGGRMCYRFEEPVHRFQNMAIDFLTNTRSQFKADESFASSSS
jgi:choline monooxygenase